MMLADLTWEFPHYGSGIWLLSGTILVICLGWTVWVNWRERN